MATEAGLKPLSHYLRKIAEFYGLTPGELEQAKHAVKRDREAAAVSYRALVAEIEADPRHGIAERIRAQHASQVSDAKADDGAVMLAVGESTTT
jgi:hypothetical protein